MFMSCMLKNFPLSLTIQDETRRCHSFFICMISRTSSESESSCNSVSNATGSVNGLMSSKSSSLNKRATLAFRRLPGSKVGSKVHLHRFLARNDSITARAGYPGLVRLSANIVKVFDPVNTLIGDSAVFLDSTCFFNCARSCGDSLLVKASKIPRESAMTFRPPVGQFRPIASVAAKHRALLTKQAVSTRGIRQQT